ncbi:hypothetical protein C0993_000600, partial [Termitomyces sp. T159_Od127]
MAVGNDGFLADINIQPIKEEKEKREDKQCDVNHFFHKPSVRQLNGKEKSCCGKYQKWAQENNFESKLPGDVKKCKTDAEHAVQTLDQDLREKKLNEHVIKYTDKVFCKAAIEWLVATDQPIEALEHPKFRHMINVTSHATDSVKIPGQK